MPAPHPEDHQLKTLDQVVCAMCGAGRGDQWETEPGRIVRHAVGSRFWEIEAMALPSADLAMLCDECQSGVEGLRNSNTMNEVHPSADAIKLLAQIRRAAVKDQLEVLDWLLKKFPKHGSK